MVFDVYESFTVKGIFSPNALSGGLAQSPIFPTNPVYAAAGVCLIKLNETVFHNTKMRKTISKMRSGVGNRSGRRNA
jgi:hypothetical protein